MSSRQEEKAARRAEREAQEAAAAKAAARAKRTQMALGSVLVLAIIGGSAAALLSSGGSGKGTGTVQSTTAKVAVPPVKETDLAKAASGAGCTVSNPPIQGSTHVTGTVNYKTNPPSSGDHNQVPAQDGIYAPGNEPAKENYVHALEHGRIEVEYRPGTPVRTISQIETVASEPLNGSDAYHVLVFQNNTQMPFQVAAVGWGHILGCRTMSPKVFDALRAFRKQYTDKGPELIP
ncbi:DUF3105 domain-containing protein [Paraconexibacter antarcticus]|uniref:DUF3105 domain-containing protein n=1 Tax=Paraconexibacter antarcticus TaxID=2949664 RepID=A0ABY5DTX4_9ACTN|nr:DUF3105 domain-containing protein [Paraconexibacter antarcticus]UTI63999.1 DUF3105 domain-containing protein [Paraconexibacter antarcticus]